MLWLALCFPRLALDRLEQADPACAGQPLVIADRLHLRLVNGPARAAGLHAGMKRATAQALAPQALFYDDDPALGRQCLETLACWALRFTPMVVPLPTPGDKAPRRAAATTDAPHETGLLLEVGASLRLFGGLDALLAQMANDLRARGWRCRTGIAPHASAAWLLALEAAAICPDPEACTDLAPLGETLDEAALRERLRALPLVRLAQARPWLVALQTLGVQTLGDLLELPRAGVAQRFGGPLLEALDRAFGQRAQARKPFRAPERFDQRLDLPVDFETVPMLMTAAERLLEALAGWLLVRQAALRRFTLCLEHHEPPVTALDIETSQPSRDPARFRELLQTRLDLLKLRGPVRALRLRCLETHALPNRSDDLFAGPHDAHEGLARLLERLQARLGAGRVSRLTLTADHRPETAFDVRVVASLEHIGPGGASGPAVDLAAGGARLPRPLWLLTEPRALGERGNRPWLARGALHLVAGPERIETGWWDERLIQRDYFVAEDDDHRLYWIYRERRSTAEAGWYMQGCFG